MTFGPDYSPLFSAWRILFVQLFFVGLGSVFVRVCPLFYCASFFRASLLLARECADPQNIENLHFRVPSRQDFLMVTPGTHYADSKYMNASPSTICRPRGIHSSFFLRDFGQ